MQEKTYHQGACMDGLAVLVLLVTYIAMTGAMILREGDERTVTQITQKEKDATS